MPLASPAQRRAMRRSLSSNRPVFFDSEGRAWRDLGKATRDPRAVAFGPSGCAAPVHRITFRNETDYARYLRAGASFAWRRRLAFPGARRCVLTGHTPITCRPPRRIPEGYGVRSILALRHAVTRGLRMHEDGGVVLPSGKRPSNRVDRDGYRSIHLGYAGKSCKITLARAICFLCNGEPPSPGYVVDHINGIKTDDRPENLRWATYEENTLNGAANRSTGHTPQRIAACLTACDGIDDPAAVLAEVRAALRHIVGAGDAMSARVAERALALLTPKETP